jgi:hypothetical protein
MSGFHDNTRNPVFIIKITRNPVETYFKSGNPVEIYYIQKNIFKNKFWYNLCIILSWEVSIKKSPYIKCMEKKEYI